MQKILLIWLILTCLYGSALGNGRMASVKSRMVGVAQSVGNFFAPTTGRYVRLKQMALGAGLFGVVTCVGLSCLQKPNAVEQASSPLFAKPTDAYGRALWDNGT